MKTTMTLRQWYGNSVRIPFYSDVWFNYFVASSMGIVHSIIQDNLAKDIRIRFGKVGTAHAEIEKGLIVIEESFLKGKFTKGKPSLPSDQTIVCLMGIVVHEAAHFAYSPATLRPWGDYIEAKCQPAIVFSREIAHTIGNIVEDIYIEAEIDRTLPLLSWTLTTLNEVFFPEEEYVKRWDAVQSLEAPAQNKEEIGNLLNFLILAKARSECEGTVYVLELFNLIRSATNKRNIDDRMELALLVYQQIMKDMKQEELPDDLSQLEIASLGAGASHNDKRGKVIHVVDAGEIDKLCEAFESARLRLSFDFPGVSGTTTLFEERAIAPGLEVLIADVRYMELAQIARQRASVNRPYGLDRKRGNNIRKLYRIATDQHIFAENVKVNNYAPMQVLVLVDCSGSMMWKNGEGKIPIALALQAGIGTVYALSEGRSSVALYGHTADQGGMSNCTMIYRIKGFNEPLTEIASKAGHLTTYDYHHSGNRDGDAILYVSEKFLGKQTERLLIVISDGQPNADNYIGQAAIDHCKGVVDGLRQQGIKVLSISIEEEASKINNQIYGEENNVFNESPDVIQQIIERIITE